MADPNVDSGYISPGSIVGDLLVWDGQHWVPSSSPNGAAALDIVQAKRSGADQLGVTVNTDIILNNTVFINGIGIVHDILTGVFTLDAGKIYELDAWGLVNTFSVASGELAIAWVDDPANVQIAESIPGVFRALTFATQDGNSPHVKACVRIGALPRNIKLRCFGGVGTATISQQFGAIIKQLR